MARPTRVRTDLAGGNYSSVPAAPSPGPTSDPGPHHVWSHAPGHGSGHRSQDDRVGRSGSRSLQSPRPRTDLARWEFSRLYTPRCTTASRRGGTGNAESASSMPRVVVPHGVHTAGSGCLWTRGPTRVGGPRVTMAGPAQGAASSPSRNEPGRRPVRINGTGPRAFSPKTRVTRPA